MTNKEILQRAQAETEKGMEYEHRSGIKVDAISSYIGMLICVLMILVLFFVKKEINFSLITVLFVMLSIQHISEGKRMNKPMLLITGGIFAIISVFGGIMFIGGLI
ncbi:MAG: hypothetical protein KBS96_08370 [Lachnospiraceae bacterium]|nr:hypothetical protein [Candidatus Colinaster scatohippi]